MRRWLTIFGVIGFTISNSGVALQAATEAQVNAAIQKGRSYLQSQLKNASGGQKSLAAYALLKTGSSKDDADIQAAIAAAIKSTDVFAPGKPREGDDTGAGHAQFAYTVPCHLFLLEAADPVAYKPQLEMLARYLAEHQQENGAWFYSIVPSPDACDTSQTQFALLGLWTAARAGVDVPNSAWDKGARWLLQAQREDGTYAYQPFNGAEKPEFKQSRYSTTVAALGSMLVIRHVFYPGTQFGDEVAEMTRPKTKKHGVLERLKDEQERQRQAGQINISAASLDKGISKSLRAVNAAFSVQQPFPNFHYYLLYATERTAALLDSETIGSHEWYPQASDVLVRLQLADGSWSDASGAIPSTSFGILCLTRATAAILGKPPGKKLGGGLLAGARGLPEDLSKLTLKDGEAKERKSLGEVDDLLAELEKTQDVSVQDVQQAILESVDLENPEQLVGQVVRLKRLAADPRAEVRRTALWAVGRSGEVRLAPLLIAGLKGVNVDVIREASYSLTVLSRKPTGLIDEATKKPISVEPLEGLPEDASEEQRREHLSQWIAHAEPAWKRWYFSVRPYEERDDRQTLQKKR